MYRFYGWFQGVSYLLCPNKGVAPLPDRQMALFFKLSPRPYFSNSTTLRVVFFRKMTHFIWCPVIPQSQELHVFIEIEGILRLQGLVCTTPF